MALITKQPKTRSQFIVFILTMTLMSMIGIFSSDIYLPSMPSMANVFNVDYSVIQKTITYYLIGLGSFQLICGPIADRFGRRKTVIVGMLIYSLASIGCVFSTHLDMLFTCRFIQAIGACTGLIMGRTIIGDLYDKKQAMHIFSIVLPLITISPIIAPVIGGYVQQFFGWRYVMAFTVLFGAILLLLITRYIGETMPGKPVKLSLKSVLTNNLRLFLVFDFMFHCLIIGLMYSNWFSYLANSAFIYKSFGLSVSFIGYCYMSQSLSSMLGSVTLKSVLKKYNNPVGINLVALSGVTIITITMLFLGERSFWWFLGLITAMTFFNGILMPTNISAAVSIANEFDSSLGGTASGLIGFIQIISGAIGSILVGFVAHTAHNLAIILTTVSIIALGLTLFKIRKT